MLATVQRQNLPVSRRANGVSLACCQEVDGAEQTCFNGVFVAESFCESVKMSKVQTLRVFVNQRLSLAAEEIFDLFERTIAEYEEQLCRSKEENERQRKLLDAVFKPQLRLHRADVQQTSVRTEEVPPQQQEWSSCLDLEDPPELPHIKQEHEELWTNQEREQLQGLEEAGFIKFTFSSKDEEKPESSQLHQNSQTEAISAAACLKTEADGDDCAGPEPAWNSDPDGHLQPDLHEKMSPSSDLESDSESETDDNDSDSDSDDATESESDDDITELDSDDGCVQEETMEQESGSTVVEKNDVPVSHDVACETQSVGVCEWDKNNFSCSFCSKTFPGRYDVERHMRVHTGEKPFSCSLCGKSFTQKSSLTSHSRVHTGEKPFTCPVCGQTFRVRHNLSAHMRIHTGERPFGCTVCGRGFTRKHYLKQHMVAHTNERPIICSICGKGFAERKDLKQHMATHIGEKPFSCSVCGQRFAHEGNLKRHMRVHTGEKPFNCTLCDKRYPLGLPAHLTHIH